MISEFLAPVEENIVDFKESLPERSIGKKINLYNKSCLLYTSDAADE